MLSLDEAIKHCNEVAERLESKNGYAYTDVTCVECTKEHRQLAEWLKELKAYKELDTYDRANKCSECEFEDSAYYCDDCIWNNVNKFKRKEVNADEDRNCIIRK